MPRSAAKSSNMGAPRSARSRSAAVTLAVIFMVMLAVAALPLFVLVVAGMLPTVGATVLDRHRALYLTRTVGAMNLAGLMPAALSLWETGISMSSLGAVAGNPYSWLVMYGAAGCGWLLYLGIPSIARIAVELRAAELQRRLEAGARMLVEEWGEEVTGRKG